jgi:hypothetical protein
MSIYCLCIIIIICQVKAQTAYVTLRARPTQESGDKGATQDRGAESEEEEEVAEGDRVKAYK